MGVRLLYPHAGVVHDFMGVPLATGSGIPHSRCNSKVIDHAIAGGRIQNFIVAIHFPFRRVMYDTGTDHIEVYINQAAKQVFIAINCRCVIAILPECTVTLLALVKLLCGPTSDQLETLRYGIDVVINDQEMNMIGSDSIIQHLKAKSLFRLKEPVVPTLPVLGKLQQEFLFMATMGYMPNLPWYMVPVSSRHS
jgi:hypothetical protein